MNLKALVDRLLGMDDCIRYVALSHGDQVVAEAKPGRSEASSAESDKYEELLVNPTLLTLVRHRGNIDCGGLDFVVIRYGHFYQLVMPVADGHLSVCIELDGDPLALAVEIRGIVRA